MPMAGRSPARFVAPLALVAFALALFIVLDRHHRRERREGSQPEQRRPPARGGRAVLREEGGTRRRSKPKTYTVRAGDTPSGIAERTGVSLEPILELNPDIDPQALTPGRAQAPPMRPAPPRRARCCSALAARRARAAPQAGRRPPDVGAPSAILVEASTGDVLFRAPPTSAADRVDHEADDRAADAGGREAVRRRHGVRYRAAPTSRSSSLRAGRAADGRRPAARAAARVRQRRGGDARRARRAARARVRAAMNRRARELRLAHALREPDRARRAGNYSSARDLARLALELRKHSFFRKIADRTSRRCHRRPRAHGRQPQHAAPPRTSCVNGLKTGHTRQRGLRPRRHAHAPTASRSSPSCSAPLDGAPATPTRSRCCAGAPAATSASRR